MIKSLSPSSIYQFLNDPYEFYIMRMVPERPPKMPQTEPMAVGSAFDALIKDYICEQIGIEPLNLYSVQVEHPDERIRPIAEMVFKHYVASPMCRELVALAKKALSEGQCLNMQGDINYLMDGVPLNGKPDFSISATADATQPLVVIDWKVNNVWKQATGGATRARMSPKPGFIKRWKCGATALPHKDAFATPVGSADGKSAAFGSTLWVDACRILIKSAPDWAIQLAIYSGMSSTAVVGIDQLVAYDFPAMDICAHRVVLTEEYIVELRSTIKAIWNVVVAPASQALGIEEFYAGWELITGKSATDLPRMVPVSGGNLDQWLLQEIRKGNMA